VLARVEKVDVLEAVVYCRTLKGTGLRGFPFRVYESHMAMKSSPMLRPLDKRALGEGNPATHYRKLLPDIPGVGPEKVFTPKQKTAIIAENIKHNQGILRSDKSGKALLPTSIRQRDVKVDPDEVNVDHYWPRSLGGWNSYQNARILSFDENLEKSDTPP
jgi:hypothetical protein